MLKRSFRNMSSSTYVEKIYKSGKIRYFESFRRLLSDVILVIATWKQSWISIWSNFQFNLINLKIRAKQTFSRPVSAETESLPNIHLFKQIKKNQSRKLDFLKITKINLRDSQNSRLIFSINSKKVWNSIN